MLDIRIWEVGAGLAVRIRTPSSQNHIIDAGRVPDFSPAEHIHRNHWREGDRLDFLVISHQDADHVADLPTMTRLLGDPITLLRNKSVPDAEKYGLANRDYQKELIRLDDEYTSSTTWESSPKNPKNNGGVTIENWANDWADCNENINNSSIVMSYLYQGVSIIFTGDIESDGWEKLREKNENLLGGALDAPLRILLAPHHGRPSGYSKDMMEYIQPSLIVISDGYGTGETDSRFRSAALGLEYKGQEKKYVTTKNNGRKRFTVSADGVYLDEFLS